MRGQSPLYIYINLSILINLANYRQHKHEIGAIREPTVLTRRRTSCAQVHAPQYSTTGGNTLAHREKRSNFMNYFINNTILLDKSYSDNAVLSYIALRGVASKDSDKEYVSLNKMLYTLLGERFLDTTERDNRAILSSLNKGIFELDCNGAITILKVISPTEYIIDLSKTNVDTNKQHFITISQEETSKIMSMSQRIDLISKIFRYFVCMLSYLNHSKALGEYQGLVGEVYFKTIYSSIGVSRRSATRYNNLLTDQKLIYIYRSKNLSTANIYSRYKDMDKCIEYGRKKEFIK
jgi:hypothetical protein